MTSRLVTGDVRERPILASGQDVRAFLSGAKTQIRRVVKPQPDCTHDSSPYWYIGGLRTSWTRRPPGSGPHWGNNPLLCPHGKVGGRLWVRETHAETECDGGPCIAYKAGGDVQMIGATGDKREGTWVESLLGPGGPDYYDVDRWRPSIHMPRWASRITLEITDVRVERLQAISAADCWAEGIPCSPDVNPIHEYQELWESINGPGSWESNPFVWAISFNRIKEPK